MTRLPRVTAVVLSYGHEPYLVECVEAIVRSTGVDLDLILLDNGADAERVQSASTVPGVTLVTPETNLGYASGCNVAADRGSGEYLVFVNSDAIVSPECIRELVGTLQDDSVGLVSASVRLADAPDMINSAGNPVHYLFFSWAGGHGEPASGFDIARPIPSVSGATFAIRSALWRSLGGFDDAYFAYGEDVDLSWRAWQAGYRVLYVPRALSLHHYEFSRNARKFYLLERNRLINLLTLPEARTRRRLAPIALVVECGLLFVALRDGWVVQKWDGWKWLARHGGYIRAKRDRIDSGREVPDSILSELLSDRVDPPVGLGLRVPAVVNDILAAYWRLATASWAPPHRRAR